jgi:hypothetical protein
MNPITQAVIQYQKSNDEVDFLPIWNHFESKIRYMAHQKALQLPSIDENLLYGVIVDALLLSIKSFDVDKGEFSTHFYIKARSKMQKEVLKLRLPKHCINTTAKSIFSNNQEGESNILPIADERPNPEEEYLLSKLEGKNSKRKNLIALASAIN